MRRTIFLSAYAAGILFWAATITGQDSRTGEEFKIGGIVVSEDAGTPLAGVAVQALRGPQAVTDDAGRFTLAPVASGSVTVRFWKSGYVLRNAVYTVGVRDLDNQRIALGKNGVISGRLFDSGGRAIPLAAVSPLFYRLTPDGIVELTVGSSTTTDDRGEFRLVDMEPGRYWINFANVFYASYPELPSPNTPAAGSITPVLYPGVGEISQAIAVEVQPGEETRLRDVVLTGTRFGAIRFHIENPGSEPPKDVVLDCCAPPLLISPTSGLQGEGPISAAASQISVRLNSGEHTSLLFWPNLPGRHRLTASWRTPEGAVDVTASIEFTGADVETRLVLANPEGRLGVRVIHQTADGSRVPLERISVNLGRQPLIFDTRPIGFGFRTQPYLIRRTGPDGDVVFDALPIGRYALHELTGLPDGVYLAEARQDNRDVLTDGIVVSNSDSPPVELEVRSGGGIVRGSVTNGSEEIHDALVTLLPEPPIAGRRVLFRRSVRTDQDGIFEIRGVAPGDYRVIAWSPQDYPPTAFGIFPDFESLASPSGPNTAIVAVEESEQENVRLTIPDR